MEKVVYMRGYCCVNFARCAVWSTISNANAVCVAKHGIHYTIYKSPNFKHHKNKLGTYKKMYARLPQIYRYTASAKGRILKSYFRIWNFNY